MKKGIVTLIFMLISSAIIGVTYSPNEDKVFPSREDFYAINVEPYDGRRVMSERYGEVYVSNSEELCDYETKWCRTESGFVNVRMLDLMSDTFFKDKKVNPEHHWIFPLNNIEGNDAESKRNSIKEIFKSKNKSEDDYSIFISTKEDVDKEYGFIANISNWYDSFFKIPANSPIVAPEDMIILSFEGQWSNPYPNSLDKVENTSKGIVMVGYTYKLNETGSYTLYEFTFCGLDRWYCCGAKVSARSTTKENEEGEIITTIPTAYVHNGEVPSTMTIKKGQILGYAGVSNVPESDNTQEADRFNSKFLMGSISDEEAILMVKVRRSKSRSALDIEQLTQFFSNPKNFLLNDMEDSNLFQFYCE